MSIKNKLTPYLGDIENLTATSSDGKKDYIHPALKNMGVVSLVLIRETIAPAVFKNQEAEITSINLDSNNLSLVRVTPTKFKFKERSNGLRILRKYGVGGNYAQNRHAVPEKKPLSEVFDMNTMVFGDSVNQGSTVLPVKAAVSYSDSLSLTSYMASVDKTFHNKASEDGSLFDAAAGKNSSSLFERHFVVPGTLLVQVITASGRTLPWEGLEHLMLSIGLSGSYGGQTSVMGTNVKTHIVGIYANLFETPETSPYILAAKVQDETNVQSAIARINEVIAPTQKVVISSQEAEEWRNSLVQQINEDSAEIRESYKLSKNKIGNLFTRWFTAGKVD